MDNWYLYYLILFWQKVIRLTQWSGMYIYQAMLNFCLMKSEVFIVLCFQPCSTCYKAIWINNCLKSTFAIKLTTEKIWQISILKGNHHMLSSNQHFLLSAKMNEIQRRALVSSWKMNCTYYDMSKGISWAEMILNSKNQAHSLTHCQVISQSII